MLRAPAAPTAQSLVVEALGYLGGVIMMVGAGILVGLYWEDIPVALKLLIVAVTTLALVVAGLAVPDRLGDAAGRLRSVLWALAVVGTAVFLTIWSTDVLDRYDEELLIVVFPGTAVVAGVLWWLRRTWLQQLALGVPLLLSAAAVGVEIAGEGSAVNGALVWGVALLWTALAWVGRLEPRVSGVAVGGLGTALGAATMDNDLGIVLGLLTTVAMVALALHGRSLLWLGFAAFGMTYTVPPAAEAWFPGRLSASLTLIVLGGGLVAAAVWVARHQGEKPPAD